MNRGRPSENASIEAITQSQAAELLNVSRPCMQRAKSVKLQAERKLGEMLKATPKNTGAKGIGPIAVPDENRNQPPTLADLGIDKKVSQ